MDSLATDWPVIRKHWEREWTRRDKALGTIRNYCKEVDRYLEWCSEEGLKTSTLGSADVCATLNRRLHCARSRIGLGNKPRRSATKIKRSDLVTVPLNRSKEIA
jgi:site-specific recombinase XerD